MTKHEKSFVDYDKTYEQNLVGMRGIIYFTVGLAVLIVLSFGLMWVLQNALEDQSAEADKQNVNPMRMNDEEVLPPEPRLQLAPGFGVGESEGQVNLELKAPQAEYQELEKQWNKLLREGQKDPHGGTAITLPIEEAKQKMLEQNPKAAQRWSSQF